MAVGIGAIIRAGCGGVHFAEQIVRPLSHFAPGFCARKVRQFPLGARELSVGC